MDARNKPPDKQTQRRANGYSSDVRDPTHKARVSCQNISQVKTHQPTEMVAAYAAAVTAVTTWWRLPVDSCQTLDEIVLCTLVHFTVHN